MLPATMKRPSLLRPGPQALLLLRSRDTALSGHTLNALDRKRVIKVPTLSPGTALSEDRVPPVISKQWAVPGIEGVRGSRL